MPDQLKNLQAAARRRGLSLHKDAARNDPTRPFMLLDRPNDGRQFFKDLDQVRDELRFRSEA